MSDHWRVTESLATGALVTGARGETPGETPVKVPTRLGSYRVLGRLGEGGQGLVYRGHDDVLDRPVALKVLSRLHSDELTDLAREARAVAAVAHPNVVQVYSAGEQDGLAWFAMELVPGPDLSEVLAREGPLPEPRARRYLAQAARGLAAAQRKNVFHRDVKPGNLVLDTRDDQVKVADFGLAQRGSVAASLTRSGLVGGTPLYVAPEVIREGSGDERADLYSLGATFFHLVAGVPPFAGASPADALVGHATLPAPDVRSVNPRVSPELAAILARCLAKSPADRYPSYDALVAAVETPMARITVSVPAPVAAAPAAFATTRVALPPVVLAPVVLPPVAPEAPRARVGAPAPVAPRFAAKAPRPPRGGRFLVLAVLGLTIAGYVRSAHQKNLRLARAREAAARGNHDNHDGPWPRDPRRGDTAERGDRDARSRPVPRIVPWPLPPARPSAPPPPPPAAAPVFEAPPVSTIPPRERFPLSVEPAFSQVAWSVRIDGANTFPDELAPSRVEKACGENVLDARGLRLGRVCPGTHLPYAVVGPASSPRGLVAWHVHDSAKRTVLCVDQEGYERATTILQLLLWLHARADEQGVPWESVVRRVRPFLPADVEERELEQIAETY